MNTPRILIAGMHSGVGKTTVSLGLMGAVKELGFRVQGFKVGPDYIDPSYHNVVTGGASENLDSWMIPHDQIIELFNRAASHADIAVIEGVMGLYDGVNGLDESGSTAEIAKILKCPVILVIDSHALARTAGALVLGFKNFDKKVNFAGVIVNRVASQTHALWCKQAIESSTGIKVIGSLPVNSELKLQERHLGLIPTVETKTFNPILAKIMRFVKNNINIDAVIEIARSAKHQPKTANPVYPKLNMPKRVAIGVAFDEAFNFYYPSNLSLLEVYGAEIKHFSPIHDPELPNHVNGLYIGGGFPEMLPKQLEDNQKMQNAIRKAADIGMPIYAECGGLMYLTDSIADFEGNTFPMVGILHGKTLMTSKTLLNYTISKTFKDNILTAEGCLLRGHEFHCSKIIDISSDAQFAYRMQQGEGIVRKQDGWIKNNILASYMHIPFIQCRQLAFNFVNACEKHKDEKASAT